MTLCPGISRHGMASQRTLLLVSSSCEIVQFTRYMTIKNIEHMPYTMGNGLNYIISGFFY